jgi:AAA15 family ATPase/GTPase
MDTFFNSVRITNFKSLKDVTLSDCKRINLLIGKPNVGKSNILEAISLFSLPFLQHSKNKKITEFIRLEHLPEFFFNGDVSTGTLIEIDDRTHCRSDFIEMNNSVRFSIMLENLPYHQNFIKPDQINNFNNGTELFVQTYKFKINNQLNFEYIDKNTDPIESKVKFYRFTPSSSFGKSSIYNRSLLPPHGVNIFEILQAHKELRSYFSKILSEYGLKLLFDKAEYALKLMKILEDDNVISFPYVSLADTLQRLIFFKTAISSNYNSILLFEEPEAHCFPPYVTHITQEIIDSETNQFFVATHSPYVLTTCLERESSRKDVAIFMVDFKDGQTVINRLTDDERDEVYEYGLDLFFNSELFTDD